MPSQRLEQPQPQPELELPQPQPELYPQPADVPPTFPLQRQTHEQPHPQLPVEVLAPPTEPAEPELLGQLSQSKQKQHFFLPELAEVPPTLPFVRQHGLQHDCPTNVGNTMPP